MLANAHNVTCSQALEVLGQIDCKAGASSASVLLGIAMSCAPCKPVHTSRFKAILYGKTSTPGLQTDSVQIQASITWFTHIHTMLELCNVKVQRWYQTAIKCSKTSHSPTRSATAALISPHRDIYLFTQRKAWHGISLQWSLRSLSPNLSKSHVTVTPGSNNMFSFGSTWRKTHMADFWTQSWVSRACLSKPGQTLTEVMINAWHLLASRYWMWWAETISIESIVFNWVAAPPSSLFWRCLSSSSSGKGQRITKSTKSISIACSPLICHSW